MPKSPRAEAAAIWRDYLEQGLIALPFAEEHGGLGGGHEDVMLVMEAYGANVASAPYLQALLAGRTLALAGASATLSALVETGARHALALFEPGQRYRWNTPSARAERTFNRLDAHRPQGCRPRLHFGYRADLPGHDG